MIIETTTSEDEGFKKIMLMAGNHEKHPQIKNLENQISMSKYNSDRVLVINSDGNGHYEVRNPFPDFQTSMSQPLWSTHGVFVSENEMLVKVQGWLNE